jgi:fumarate reductase flavoprotein subunit
VAGEVMTKYVDDNNILHKANESIIEDEINRALLPFSISGKAVNVNYLREELMDIMWQDVGIARSAEGIQHGIERVNQLRSELLKSGIGETNRVFNPTWHDWINLYNLIDTSLVIAKAALSRENSRGAHYREDFPEPGELKDSYFTVVRSKHGSLDVELQPVEFSIIKPGESLIENYPGATIVTSITS